MFERVKFYSIDDLGNAMELLKAGEILEAYSEDNELENINDAIEYYNIKLFLDNHLALKTWSKDQIMKYENNAKTFGKLISHYFQQHFTEANALSLFKSLFYGYEQDFWDIFEKYNLIRLLSSEIVLNILDVLPDEIENILHCRKIVESFDSELSVFLQSYPKTTELLVDAYLVNHPIDRKRSLIIPSHLTNEQKRTIVDRYLEVGNARLNTIRIIMQTPDVKGLNLTPKIRLKAKHLERELANVPMDTSVSCVQYGFSIVFKQDNGIPPVSLSLDNLIQKFVYSEMYLDKLSDVELFNCFHTLFNYTDKNGLVTLCFNQNENNLFDYINTQEIIGMYRINDFFWLKNNIALFQLMMFDDYLHRRSKSIVSLIKNYYEVHFRDDYNYPSYALNLPMEEDTFANKNKVIAPEMEAVVKMFDLYVEEGEINSELYEYKMCVPITKAKSLLYKHKYVVIKEDLNQILYEPLRLLFSNQTLLSFVDPYKDDHYQTLFKLLSSGNTVYYSNYESFQKTSIDYLIQNGYLKIEEHDKLVFDNYYKIHALELIWNRHEISYYNCQAKVQTEIDKMVKDGLLEYDDYLLSPSERHFFNFYLNNTEYSNGFQLRNKYSHGVSSCFTSETDHKNAYYKFIMLFVILLLKMDEDMKLSYKNNLNNK